MHFTFVRKVAIVLVIVAVVLVGVAAYLSLPRAYLLMATTTSTRDTGLLPYLLPHFTAEYGIEVRYIAVGTGQAIDAGRRGDVDIVMVHAPSLEANFTRDGDGLCRNLVMYNRFVIVGPVGDPAGVAIAASPADAFARIYQNGSLFESRADNSGTYTKEVELWSLAGLNASTFGAWYEKTNQGMGATLTIANNKGAYTLSDNATWYALESNLAFLDLHYNRDDSVLRNQYSVIPVNPALHPGVFVDRALAFARWLITPGAQGLIGNFTVGGHTIFTPNGAGAC